MHMVHETNLSSQCHIEMEQMASSNCSHDMFASLSHKQLSCNIILQTLRIPYSTLIDKN